VRATRPSAQGSVSGGFDDRLRLRLMELDGSTDPRDIEFHELAEVYLRLEERLAKIIAIGDKYQAEALSNAARLKDALETLESLKASLPPSEAPGQDLSVEDRRPSAPSPLESPRRRDPLLERLRSLLSSNTPIPPADLAALLGRCEKLDARMDKIVTISDRYQSQLRDISMRMDFMARTDPLTKLSNRRDMMERLDREIARFDRYGTKFSVILFDIDDFKRVNDSYGHDAGDRVLQGVALAFLRELRRSDGCSRWGGEEFLILCPETGLEEARVVGEKCREAVAGVLVEAKAGSARVTLSGGLAAMEKGLDRDSLIILADERLYNAKGKGKNSLC
jgi:diguanylate cyclase